MSSPVVAMTFIATVLAFEITVLSTRGIVFGLPLPRNLDPKTSVSEAMHLATDCFRDFLLLVERKSDSNSATGAVSKFVFYGLPYSPFGLGDKRLCPPWDNNGGMCLPQDQVFADLRQIGKLTKRIKLYSSTCVDGTKTIMDYAVQNRLEITLGVWISGKSSEDELEFAHLQELMSQSANAGVVKSIVVGNEAVFRIGMGIE
jgi:exo-beta-1,3-glucanase (GH17 family)